MNSVSARISSGERRISPVLLCLLNFELPIYFTDKHPHFVAFFRSPPFFMEGRGVGWLELMGRMLQENLIGNKVRRLHENLVNSLRHLFRF